MMGSGAMGGLFGGLLTRSGKQVWLVGNRKEQIDRIAQLVSLLRKKESRRLPR